jgi:alpha-D-ribose 1-methylphosphonate 5-triphosphate synthase subunit PhnG
MTMQQELTPGQIVCNPAAPDWGLGQVQSVVGARVTVNFENMGKMTINTAVVTLDIVDDGART